MSSLRSLFAAYVFGLTWGCSQGAAPRSPGSAQVQTSSSEPAKRSAPASSCVEAAVPEDGVPGPSPDAEDPVKAFNEWAYRFNEQRDLALLATFGVRRYEDVDVTIAIDYERGELPKSALAVVTQERFLDDSIFGERVELKFSRFDCPSCEPGPARWRLESRRVLVKCWPGRGHEDYSEDKCN
jgi:hypothetical protein